jgi:hypothetical protein
VWRDDPANQRLDDYENVLPQLLPHARVMFAALQWRRISTVLPEAEGLMGEISSNTANELGNCIRVTRRQTTADHRLW